MHWFWLTLPLSCGTSISYAHCPLAAPPTSFLNTVCSFTLLLFPVEGPFPPVFTWWAPQLSRLTQGFPWDSFLNAPYFQSLFYILSVVVTPWPHNCDIVYCLQDHEIFKAGKYGSMPCLRVRFGSSFHHSDCVTWKVIKPLSASVFSFINEFLSHFEWIIEILFMKCLTCHPDPSESSPEG